MSRDLERRVKLLEQWHPPLPLAVVASELEIPQRCRERGIEPQDALWIVTGIDAGPPGSQHEDSDPLHEGTKT
jgi:hypothetical protein